MVRGPRTRLNRLKQLNPHAGVAAGRTEALAALAADRPTIDVTATPAASTEHALAKRLRMKDFLPVSGNHQPTAFWPGGLGGQAITGTAGDNAAQMLAEV